MSIANNKFGRRGPSHRIRAAKAQDAISMGTGWIKDRPDFRDTTCAKLSPKFSAKVDVEVFDAHGKIQKKFISLKKRGLKESIDNRKHCSPVENQGQLGSCTANACAGMVEYMQNKVEGTYDDASRLFLYKVTRNLLGWEGDTGAFLRTTMKALVLFGMPPENQWPYDEDTFEEEPDPYLYAYASNYKALQYMRLDAHGMTPDEMLFNIKAALQLGFVSMFGFTTYSSMTMDEDIPFPSAEDSEDGGHAVLAVGFDDKHKVGRKIVPSLIIKNSWGADFGAEGYGYLPYQYILEGLATDFWTCFKLDWVSSRTFL